MVALVHPRTEANAFPYMRVSRTCRPRLIGQIALEVKQFFRRAKFQGALGWPCLPTPRVISLGFFWESRTTNVDANARKRKLCQQWPCDFQLTTLGEPHHELPGCAIPSVGWSHEASKT